MRTVPTIAVLALLTTVFAGCADPPAAQQHRYPPMPTVLPTPDPQLNAEFHRSTVEARLLADLHEAGVPVGVSENMDHEARFVCVGVSAHPNNTPEKVAELGDYAKYAEVFGELAVEHYCPELRR